MWETLKGARGKLPQVAVGVVIGLLVGGGSYAVAQQAGTESEDGGVHGGPKARYHSSACNLVDTSALQGNWTHGDYVSAVAAQDPSNVAAAAHSRCGKPEHAAQGAAKQARVKNKQENRSETPTPETAPTPTETEPAAGPSPTVSVEPTASATATTSTEPSASPSETATLP